MILFPWVYLYRPKDACEFFINLDDKSLSLSLLLVFILFCFPCLILRNLEEKLPPPPGRFHFMYLFYLFVNFPQVSKTGQKEYES